MLVVLAALKGTLSPPPLRPLGQKVGAASQAKMKGLLKEEKMETPMNGLLNAAGQHIWIFSLAYLMCFLEKALLLTMGLGSLSLDGNPPF